MNINKILASFLSCFTLFSFILEAVSLSGSTSYPQFCEEAAQDEAVFTYFKSNSAYQQVLENLDFETGKKYLDAIIQNSPEFIPLFERFRENDRIGHPVIYNYGEYGWFSPTTLRYIKVASDIKQIFGSCKDIRIVEIGGGYGGQCKILADALGFASYTLLELPECINLAQRYLLQLNVEHVHFADPGQLPDLGSFDLVISNYAFSELDSAEQAAYIEHVIKNTPRGYMTMNFISHHLQSMSIEDLVRLFFQNKRQGKVEKEHPNTHPDNCTITWSPVDPAGSLPPEKFPRMRKGLQTKNGITYNFSHLGRLGDNLLAYFHAKWVAYQTKLPFYYIPFSYSDAFCLSDRDQPLTSAYSFTQHVTIQDINQIHLAPTSTLFTIPYFPETQFEYQMCALQLLGIPFFQINWKDPGFRAEVKACLNPKKEISTFELPKNRITVGVHVRRGSAQDQADVYRFFPLKFPPDDYYIQQIQTVAKIFKDQPLYVHILTDDLHPEAIIKKYKAALRNPHIKFGYRKQNKWGKDNSLEDFFTIQKFDCLILSQSNFSLVASKVKDYDVMIAPLHAIFIEEKHYIDEFELSFHGH